MKHILLISLLLLSACTGLRVETADVSRFAEGGYRSYAWLHQPVTEAYGLSAKYYYLDHHFRRSVDRQLQAKGYRQVNKAEADFVLEYRQFQSISVDQGGLISPTNEMAAAVDNGSDINQTAIHNHFVPAAIGVGNLELSFLDNRAQAAKGHGLLWRGRAYKVTEKQQPSESEISALMKAVAQRILQGIPQLSSELSAP